MDKCNNCTKYNDCKESGFVPCCGAYVPRCAPPPPEAELTAWRALGPSPEAVAAELERLRERLAAYDMLDDFERNQCARSLLKLGEAERQVQELTKTLDAAMADLRMYADCDTCAHSRHNKGPCHGGCRGLVGSEYTYKWRGAEAALAAREEQSDG